jgi:hypothetical protein
MRLLFCLTLLSLAACATAARATIENRLVSLGLSQARASCMASELDERLDDGELTELARHTFSLSRADDPAEVVEALGGIDDFTIARAVASSGIACILPR